MPIPDADVLVQLWNESCQFDCMSRTLFDEKTVGDDAFDDRLLVRYHDGSRTVGFAFGVIRPVDEGRRGHIKMFAVHPEYRYRGIASALLNDIEKTFADLGVGHVRLGESAPNYLMPGLDPRYTGAKVFFERRGFQRFGETWNLSVDLEKLDGKDNTVDGFAIRRATGDDCDRMLAFLSTRWKAWTSEINRSFENDPVSLHLALSGSDIVAFSAYDCNNVGTGWFGPMGTDESARGSGLGAELLRRCLIDLKRQGLAEATIPWVGPISFYSRHVGAVVSRVFYRYEKNLT